MLFAITEPVSLLGLLLAFLLGVAVRAAVQVALARRLLRHDVGSVLPHLRRDIDPFGALAAALGGTGWGREAPLPETGWVAPRRGRRATVLAAGPVAVIVLGLAVLIGYRVVAGDTVLLSLLYASDVLRGITGTLTQQFLISLGVGLLCFGVLAFLPLPPLDGWGLLWLAIRRPGEGAQKARYWLQERNIGILILLVLIVFSFGARRPLLLFVLDLAVNPLMRLAAG